MQVTTRITSLGLHHPGRRQLLRPRVPGAERDHLIQDSSRASPSAPTGSRRWSWPSSSSWVSPSNYEICFIHVPILMSVSCEDFGFDPTVAGHVNQRQPSYLLPHPAVRIRPLLSLRGGPARGTDGGDLSRRRALSSRLQLYRAGAHHRLPGPGLRAASFFRSVAAARSGSGGSRCRVTTGVFGNRPSGIGRISAGRAGGAGRVRGAEPGAFATARAWLSYSPGIAHPTRTTGPG